MLSHNHCFVVGNLGNDPVVRGQTAAAGPIVGFTIAENVSVFDRETKAYKTVHTNWFSITAFGSLAERVSKNLKKGDRVAIQGRMKIAKFKDKAGEEKTGFEIVADEVAQWKSLPAATGSGGASVVRPRGAERGYEHAAEAVMEENLPF